MDFKVLFTQLVTLYDKLTKQQKMIIAFAIVGIIAFLVFLIVYTSKSGVNNRYEALFNSLTPEDAAKVIDQLEKDEIPYEIAGDNIIKVPKNVVYKERITIASMGIPKNRGVGFELFDTQEFGATSFDQQIKHLRALEGELARTISGLAPIESATVALALPKETLFVAKQSLPTASVMVTLVEGRRLSLKQIKGIKNLVAASVPNLKVENVTLVNSDGETLGDSDEMMQMGELSVVQQKYKSLEERKRQKKIIEVVAPFVGGEKKVVAQVTIEYDFSQQESTSEKYDPESVVRSEQVNEEKKEGLAPKQVGGVPGTVSNIGPVKELGSKQAKQKYEKSSTTTNYEIGKTISKTKSQFARIKRISAAVLVDGKYEYKKDKDGKKTDELEYQPLSQSELQALKSLVRESIGIDEKRGDKISVENLQFKHDAKDPTMDGVAKVVAFSNAYLAPFSEVFKYIFVLILLFVLYKKVIIPFSERMLEISKEDDDFEKPILDLDEEEDDDLVERAQAMRKKVEDQLGVNNNFNESELKYEVLLEKVRTMTEEKPEEVASLLQALLAEEAEGSNGLGKDK